jgi:hypothetical protein
MSGAIWLIVGVMVSAPLLITIYSYGRTRDPFLFVAAGLLVLGGSFLTRNASGSYRDWPTILIVSGLLYVSNLVVMVRGELGREAGARSKLRAFLLAGLATTSFGGLLAVLAFVKV